MLHLKNNSRGAVLSIPSVQFIGELQSNLQTLARQASQRPSEIREKADNIVLFSLAVALRSCKAGGSPQPLPPLRPLVPCWGGHQLGLA